MKESKVTLNSKIGELYASPIGHDTIGKVLMQLNVSDKVITNPLVSNIKLKTLANLTKGKLGPGFFDTLLNLINMEKDTPFVSRGPITKQWWKEAVFYQIYPRSFMDSNNDGIGDLRGIISKLDYLKDLGVDCIWLSPIYDSPMDDNGYDIRDYRAINPDFGTMEEFDELLTKVHEKGMRLIMDLVVNHTSDEHEWFKKALEDPTSKYRDYYFLKEDDGTHSEPNDWTSFFSGPAWNYYEEQNLWGLHLFSKKQMDLNWDNPCVRDDVVDMINWWLDKGVDGFRMDVINYISKEEGLPMADPTIGAMMGYPGIEHYYYGPNLHKYLHEVKVRAFEPHKAFSVGETPGIGMNMAQLITGEERRELDMVFSFDQLETPGHVRWDDYEYDLEYYKKYITEWMLNYGNNCWMSLFYNNHDNPRMVSKISTDSKFTKSIETLLAVMQLTLKGTPFIFQGDEMGLINYPFKSVDEIGDVETVNLVKELREKGKSEEEIFKTILAGTREHTRVLLPWNEYLSNYGEHLRQEIHEDITSVYKELIALRKCNEALIYGDFKVLDDSKGRFVYSRVLGDKEFIIDCNLTKESKKAYSANGYKRVFPSMVINKDELKAYEARILVKE